MQGGDKANDESNRRERGKGGRGPAAGTYAGKKKRNVGKIQKKMGVSLGPRTGKTKIYTSREKKRGGE